MNTLLIKDQTIGGDHVNEINLQFENDLITLKDLIEARVVAEVAIYNKREKIPYYGLVVPKAEEQLLNKTKDKTKKLIDAEKQIYVALDAFLKNQFFVLVNDKQIDDLEYELDMKSIKEVQFIKLTPLVGG